MSSETSPLGVPVVSPLSAIPDHERVAERTDVLEVRTSNPPVHYTIVRLGTGWPGVRQANPKAVSSTGRSTDAQAPQRGRGEGSPRVSALSSITPAADIFSTPRASGSHPRVPSLGVRPGDISGATKGPSSHPEAAGYWAGGRVAPSKEVRIPCLSGGYRFWPPS
jgi:hypothetical protein